MKKVDRENVYRGCWKVVDDDSRLFNQEHPLLNELLLEKIFHYANPNTEDLKIIRLICKTWNNLIKKKWRQTATVKIIKEKEVFTSLPPQNGIRACEFFARFEDPTDPFELKEMPFIRYKFMDIQIDLGQHENPMSKSFWMELGPHIKYLHLEKCSLHTSVPIPMETLVLEKVVNLEELVLTNTVKLENWSELESISIASLLQEKPKKDCKLKRLVVHGKISPFTFPELLRCCPDLEQLELGHLENLKTAIWKAILISRRNTNFTFCNLKHVDLIHFPNALPHMASFYLAKFPLEVLRVQMTAPDDRTDFTTKLLPAYSHSLQVLEIFCPLIVCQSTLVMPPIFMTNMTNLTALRLWGPAVDNLSFLEFMPNLKSLWINLLCVEKWEEVQHAVRKVPSADYNVYVSPLTLDIVEKTQTLGTTNLEHFHIDYKFSVNSLQLLANWMPKLTKLETILDDKTFVAVGRQWPNLKELRCLLGSTIDDNVITGTHCMEEDDCMLPGIKGFRYLTSFQLDAFCGEAKLTDESLVNGFLDMLSLDILKICVSPEMSERAEMLLKQAIPQVQVLRTYSNDTSEDSPHTKVCNACKTQKNANFRSSGSIQCSTILTQRGHATFEMHRFNEDGKVDFIDFDLEREGLNVMRQLVQNADLSRAELQNLIAGLEIGN